MRSWPLRQLAAWRRRQSQRAPVGQRQVSATHKRNRSYSRRPANLSLGTALLARTAHGTAAARTRHDDATNVGSRSAGTHQHLGGAPCTPATGRRRGGPPRRPRQVARSRGGRPRRDRRTVRHRPARRPTLGIELDDRYLHLVIMLAAECLGAATISLDTAELGPPAILAVFATLSCCHAASPRPYPASW